MQAHCDATTVRQMIPKAESRLLVPSKSVLLTFKYNKPVGKVGHCDDEQVMALRVQSLKAAHAG